MSDYLPVALKIRGWRCVVIGGGAIAARRVEPLLEAGAHITVAAPVLTESLQRLVESGRIEHAAAEYDVSHLGGARLVIAATDRPDVNKAVARDAEALGVLVNDADESSRGDVIFPSVVRRGDLILSVTTAGGSPSLAKRIRDELAALYGPEWEPYVALLGEVRRQALAAISEPGRRRQALNAVAEDAAVLDLIREGRTDEARARALSCISPSSD